MPEVLDLFAGCGGFSLGFHLAGYHIKAHIENDVACCQTLRRNFPNSEVLEQDITQIELYEWKQKFIDIDILLAGPPCQGFSVAGTSWVDCDRIQTLNNLYLIPIAITEKIKPKVVIIENVPTVLSRRNIFYVIIAITRLQNLGYNVFPSPPRELDLTIIEDFYTLSKDIASSLSEYGANSKIKLLSDPERLYVIIKKCRNIFVDFPSTEIFSDFYSNCWKKIKNHSKREQLSKTRLDKPKRMNKYILERGGAFKSYTTTQLAQEVKSIIEFLDDEGFLLDEIGLGKENLVEGLQALNTVGRAPELPSSLKFRTIGEIKTQYKKMLDKGEEWSKSIRKHAILKAKNYGAPEERHRLFIIAFKSTPHPQPPQPGITSDSQMISLNDVLSDLPFLTPGEGTDQQVSYRPVTDLSDYQMYLRKNSTGIFNHRARSISDPFYLLRYALLYQGANDLTFPFYLQKFSKTDFIDTWSRLNGKKLSKVIFAHLSKDGNSHIHPFEERSITVREAARIQGFPDNFVFPPSDSFSEHFRQIGNAVSVQMAKALAVSIGKQQAFCLEQTEFQGSQVSSPKDFKIKKSCNCLQAAMSLRGTTSCSCGQYKSMKLTEEQGNRFLDVIKEFHLGKAQYEKERGYIIWDEIEAKEEFNLNSLSLKYRFSINSEDNQSHSLEIFQINIQREGASRKEKGGYLGGWKFDDKTTYWFTLINPNLPWSIQRNIIAHSDFPYSIKSYFMMNRSPEVFCKYVAFLIGIEDPVFHGNHRQKTLDPNLEDFFPETYPIPLAINREWIWEKFTTTIKVFETIWKQNDIPIGVLIKIEVFQLGHEFTAFEAIVSKLKNIEDLDNMIIQYEDLKRIYEYDRLQSNLINFYSHMTLYDHHLVSEKDLKLYWGETCFKKTDLI